MPSRRRCPSRSRRCGSAPPPARAAAGRPRAATTARSRARARARATGRGAVAPPRENDDLPLLRLPDPYDFELSTERFRAFGPDRANLWHEGGLHRVVGGREIRIEAAPGGVRVDPLDACVEAEVRKLLGLEFDLGSFAAFAAADDVLAAVVPRLAGF